MEETQSSTPRAYNFRDVDRCANIEPTVRYLDARQSLEGPSRQQCGSITERWLE